jgi:hypothetical protein
LIDGHAPSGDVAGSVSEELEDGLGFLGDEGIDGGEEGEENVFARELTARMPAERDGKVAQVFGEFGLVDVDADAGDGHSIDQLYEDAGGLAVIEHEVVGPAQVALNTGGLSDGFDRGDAEGKGEDGGRVQDEGAVDAVAGFGVPSVAVTSLAGELAIGQYDGAGLGCGGDALGGIDGIEVNDVAFGEGLAEAGEINHRRAPTARRAPVDNRRAG